MILGRNVEQDVSPTRMTTLAGLGACVCWDGGGGGWGGGVVFFSFLKFSKKPFLVICKYVITKTRLFKYIERFTSEKCKFSDKNSDIFRISAQNIDCGYSLEPPRRGGSNEYPQSMFFRK